MTSYKGTLNEVQIIGNLTADPEIRQAGNAPVANIRLATNRGYKGQDGNTVEEAEYHTVVMWSKMAEIAEKWLKKGKKIYIKGRLQTRKWETKEGDTRYSTEIVATDMMMLGGGDGNGSSGSTRSKSSSRSQEPQQGRNEAVEDDDDLPF